MLINYFQLACNSNCLTCSAGSASDCLSCHPSTYLNLPPKGQCTSTCPTVYYPDDSFWECRHCYQSASNPFSCATCIGPADGDCRSCTGSTFLHPSPTGQCLNPCPDGYYEDISTHKCMPCYQSTTSPFTCKTCIGSYNYSCTSCINGRYLYPVSPSGQCVNPCADGFYGDNSNNQCARCFQGTGLGNPYSCRTCSGSGSSACTSCNPGTWLTGGQCLNACPLGTWPDSSTNICQPCYQNTLGPQFSCLTCNSGAGDNCLSCDTGSFLAPTPVGECLASCPAGFWPDSGTRTCKICYQNSANPLLSCLTCNGGTSSSCLSCHVGAFLSSVSGGSCVTSCPSNKWANPITRTCEDCYQNTVGPAFSCATCNGANSYNCTSCASNTYLYPAEVGQCLGTCPAGYYGDSTTHTCEKCAEDHTTPLFSCITCSAGTLNDCLSCYSGTYLYPNTGGTCSPSCPVGFWPDNSTNTCQQCYQSAIAPFTCVSCSGPGATNCLSCDSQGFLDVTTGSCVADCPIGYWGNTADRVCYPCYSAQNSNDLDGTCRSCIGPNANQCTSCFEGRFYSSTTGTCVEDCPPGWFPNMTTRNCDACFMTSSTLNNSRTCATCSGGNYYECLSCESNAWLYLSQCVGTCPDGTYPSNQAGTCDPCFQASSELETFRSCLTCSGPNSTNCLSCDSSAVLYPPQMSCLYSCPKPLWYLETNNTCAQCYQSNGSSTVESYAPQSCLECNGPFNTNCLRCSPGAYLWPGNNTCVAACPNSSYYGDTSTWTCRDCSVPSNLVDYSKTCAPPTLVTTASTSAVLTGNIVSLATSLVSGGLNPGSVFLSNFMSVVTIYIYINVDFPSNFVNFVLSVQLNSLIPNPFILMREEKNLALATTGKFSYWLTNTAFLENCGFYITKDLTLFFFIVIVSLVTRYWNPNSKFYEKLKKFRDSVRWNLFLASYLGDFPLMLIFSLLHLIENNNPGAYADFSLFFAVIILLSYAALFVYFVFQLNRKKDSKYAALSQRPSQASPQSGIKIDEVTLRTSPGGRLSNPSDPDSEWVEVSRAVNAISSGFKDDNWFSRNFMVLSMIQELQIVLLISLTQFSGVIQAIIYTVISLAYLIAFLKFRPLKSKVVAAMIILNQLIKSLMGGIAVFLGFESVFSSGIPDSTNQVLGTVLIVTISVTAGINVLLGIFLVIAEIVTAFQKYRKKRQSTRARVFKIPKSSQATTMMQSQLPITDFQHDSFEFGVSHDPPKKLPKAVSDSKPIRPLTPVDALVEKESPVEQIGYQRDLDFGFKFTKRPTPQFNYPRMIIGNSNAVGR